MIRPFVPLPRIFCRLYGRGSPVSGSAIANNYVFPRFSSIGTTKQSVKKIGAHTHNGSLNHMQIQRPVAYMRYLDIILAVEAINYSEDPVAVLNGIVPVKT
jgi:hypothetical protein